MEPTIQIVSEPYAFGPNPVENCVEYCFEANDIVLKGATQALACMVFEDGVAPYDQDDQIVFAGTEITIGTGVGELDLTSTSVSANLATFENFLNTTYPFNIDTDILIGGFGNIATICVRWCAYEFRENFDFDDTQNNNVIAFANGDSGEIVKGFRMVYQLMCLDENQANAKSICPLQIKEVSIAEGNIPQLLCIDLQHELSDHVFTTIPKCNDDIIDNETMYKWFQLKYGFQQRDPEDNCGIIYGGFQDSIPFLGINQAINLEDGEDGASCYRMTNGPVEFLTSKDVTRIEVCATTCEWLFLASTWENFFPGFNSFNVEYSFFDENGNELLTFVRPFPQDGVAQIPAGPQNILDVFFPLTDTWPEIICKYEITVIADTAGGSVPYSETATFLVDHNCCCAMSIYYLDSKGGYSRMPFECINSQSFVDNATEICLDTKCGTFQEDLLSGKKNIDSESYSTMTLTTKKMKKTEQTMCELRAFKASESKFYLFTDKKGQTNCRRLVGAGSTTRIFEKDGLLVLSMTLAESQNYNTISNG